MVHPCPADSVKGSYRCSALLKDSWQGKAWPPTGGFCRQRTKAPSKVLRNQVRAIKLMLEKNLCHCFVALTMEGYSIQQKTSTDRKNWDQKKLSVGFQWVPYRMAALTSNGELSHGLFGNIRFSLLIIANKMNRHFRKSTNKLFNCSLEFFTGSWDL